jgi:hypothetical protein
MEPITLFDKSFLQALSVDESVWFDNFFYSNVCPLFYVETLADLEKSIRKGRTPEQEVGIIANKFPEIHGAPNVSHIDLCVGNLLGHEISMVGQIIMSGGHYVKANGKTGVVFNRSPEAEAFYRWQNREFLSVERNFAKKWRNTISSLNLGEMSQIFDSFGVNSKKCRTLLDAKMVAESFVNGNAKPFEKMRMVLLFLNVPKYLHRKIMERWSISNYSPLINYAPYVAHVLTVEIFFQVALAANLISKERVSNRIDIGYLFYLPFCMIFVSSDKLHKKCAPLFLRNDQKFVWGFEMKEGLSALNDHYSLLSDEVKEQGIMSFASHPPTDGDFYVSQIWDWFYPEWRKNANYHKTKESYDDSKLVEMINGISKSPPLNPEEIDFDMQNADSMCINRKMHKMKGKWWQLPKDIEVSKEQ